MTDEQKQKILDIVRSVWDDGEDAGFLNGRGEWNERKGEDILAFLVAKADEIAEILAVTRSTENDNVLPSERESIVFWLLVILIVALMADAAILIVLVLR